MEINGAGAVVTGGASGLGAATARALVDAGAVVTLLDFDADRGAATAKELGATFVRTDVTDPLQVTEAVAAAAEQAPLRIGVNCAGIGDALRTIGRDGTPHDPQRWARVLHINLFGVFHALTIEAAQISRADALADGSRGVIVNTASIAAWEGQIGQLAYAASKGGVVAMTLPAARDLAVAGIRVCTIAPGLMNTPLLGILPQDAMEGLNADIIHPKRLGLPEEFAKLVLAIIDNDYLNGEVVRLDGALRMPPK